MRLDHLLSKEKVGVVLLSGFQNGPEKTGGARQRNRTDQISVFMMLIKANQCYGAMLVIKKTEKED